MPIQATTPIVVPARDEETFDAWWLYQFVSVNPDVNGRIDVRVAMVPYARNPATGIGTMKKRDDNGLPDIVEATLEDVYNFGQPSNKASDDAIGAVLDNVPAIRAAVAAQYAAANAALAAQHQADYEAAVAEATAAGAEPPAPTDPPTFGSNAVALVEIISQAVGAVAKQRGIIQ